MDTLQSYRRALEAQGAAAATIRAKVGAVAGLAAWADVDPVDLTAEDLEGWLGSRPLARWSRIKYLDHVRAFCSWAHMADITDGVRRPRAPAPSPRPAPEAAVTALMAHRDPRVRAWTALGAFAGLRSAESAAVAVEDIEVAADGSRVLRVCGKGGQVAVVPLAAVVLEQLGPFLGAGARGRLWPEARPWTVQRAIRTAAAEAGFTVTSHMLRHRYGTMFYAESRDLLLTRDAMRHRSAASTEIYVDVGQARAAAVIARLPGAGAPASSSRPALQLIRGGAGS